MSDERYVPLGKNGAPGDAQSNIYFMVRGLLSSRIHTGIASDEPNDEDVTIYLTHLLCGYIKPQYHLNVCKYLAAYDSTVFDRLRYTDNGRLKYTVYRANADHILMSVGLFRNATGKRAVALPAILQTDAEVHAGRGKTYYDFASTYSRTLFGPSSAITDVLGKLAARFDQYVQLLANMGVEYLDLAQKLTEAELYHLKRSINAHQLPQLRNDFLDAFSDWRRQPIAANRDRVQQLADAIQALDPSFRFTWTDD